jgi:hypothetical protein
MNKTSLFAASSIGLALLLTATPALAEHRDSDQGGNNGWHLGALFNAPLVNVGIGSFKNDDKDPVASTTKPMKMPFSGTAEIGVVSGVNGPDLTLSPAINLSGTSTAPTTVVTNSSTTFKGGATSTASLTSGEKVIIVGTSSTSTPGVITASIVIAIQNAWHFCTHLFSK